MRKKKDLPLSILKSLEPFVDLKGEKFEVVDSKDNLLKVTDIDPDSAFHFTIEKYQKKSNSDTFIFLVKRTPKSIDEIYIDVNWFEASAINGQFNDWLILLNEYDTVKSFCDDPIIKSFQEEFYTEFELIDVDVDTSPFKTSQILMLDSYLEAVDNRMTEFITENNSCEIADIKADINLLRNNLTSKSKKWVVKELTTIWAKIAKQGTIFIREFLTESKKEVIKQTVKGILELVIENGSNLLN